mmetsp:Transcript_44281/g.70792  ORF Transcript_44281/g.70792 Transcript_44281/m.70792 type:complete len:134 (-) Transcript_44281:481-882(-)
MFNRLKSYDATNDIGHFVDGCYPQHEIMVDTGLVSPFDVHNGSLCSVIGEVYLSGDGERCDKPAIRARTITAMDGIDIGLYIKALELRRKFLGEETRQMVQISRELRGSDKKGQDQTSADVICIEEDDNIEDC